MLKSILICTAWILASQSRAVVLPHQVIGSTISIPASSTFTYSYLGLDARTSPVIGCVGSTALLFANGGLQILDFDSLEMTTVKGSEGVAFGGWIGSQFNGNRVLLTMAHQGPGRDEEVYEFYEVDIPKKELTILKDGPRDIRGSRTHRCDLPGGRRLQVSEKDFKVMLWSGPALVDQERWEWQSSQILLLEKIREIDSQGGIPNPGRDEKMAFDVLRSARSTKEKIPLMARLAKSTAQPNVQIVGLCSLATYHRKHWNYPVALWEYYQLKTDFAHIVGPLSIRESIKYCDGISARE